ncbi:SWIM zinc finger family protein [Rhodocytophaga aerolata]|uniref:SWIM zinc finger family protein n=1 Tax=Rhodocytophaga aerolata TaxID=455078 RepID=A0ABT8RCF8_9BACT|nr:SWIM zinc finger family protein [Rhodocytophaga aerolata]MDO1449004.1 SWIM zinc finger family protein [Rhodocytophaga aerolata]
MTWTEEQILALSPDASSTKSGKDLAKPTKWVTAGVSGRALWGECQGSGSLPYRTQIDLRDTAFKCTCPSRKFPCKHGLGLFLLYVHQPVVFKQVEEADWVKEWIDKRGDKLQKKVETKTEDIPDTKAQAKRIEARKAKVEAGVEEIELWIKDLIRNGLITAPDKSPKFWQTAASRMVDAQAPGLANMIRSLGELNYFSDNWQSLALQQLTKLYLAVQGFKRIDTLPEALQADIRSMIGWTQKAEELKTADGLHDHWLVLGRQTEQEGDITVQRNWLYGVKNQQFALILNFAYRTQTVDLSLVPGTAMEAELVFYPGSIPLRALLKERIRTVEFPETAGFADWQAVSQVYATQCTLSPWIHQWPVIVENITVFPQEKQWLLKDSGNRVAMLDKKFDKLWKLLAYSGGHPLTMSFVREDDCFLPLGLWFKQRYLVL